MKRYKSILLSSLSGILLGLPWSFPPLFFLIFVAWIPLLYIEEKMRYNANPYTVFNYSLPACMAWNILGTWWIVQAQWIGAICIILLNSLIQSLIVWVISRTRTNLRIALPIPFLLIWMGFEHIHQFWELAWPWLNLGNSMATAPNLIQWYEYSGVRGGSLWIILVNMTLWYSISSFRERKYNNTAAYLISAILLIIIPIKWSLSLKPSQDNMGEAIQVVIIQPNLDPYTEKFVPEKQTTHITQFLKTADSACTPQTKFLIGPETLIIQQIEEQNPETSPYYQQLQEFHKKHPKLNTIIGIHSFERVTGVKPPASRYNPVEKYHYEAFNTALFYPYSGNPQFYHKAKLVPLFERMPFVDYLQFLGKYSLELGGYNGTYSSRQASSSFNVPNSSITILPIICFESVFGPYCAQRLTRQEGFICLITNDGWWKNTPGYRHHLNFSILRAIETRRDIVRVANTGISALIDAQGTVIVSSHWWKRAVLKGQVHLRSGQTFFSQYGDYLGRISLFFGGLIILIAEIHLRIIRHKGKS